MRRIIVFVVLMFAGVAAADHQFGKQVRFVGIHPIPKSEGGGMCNIEGPHVHIYAANKLEYRDHRGDNYFVGDPVAYKYDGPKYAYKGPHPIQVEAVVGGDPDVEYCYLEGPHFHYFKPVEGPDWKLQGDAYFYVGEPPHAFIEARPAFVGINAVYRPLVYTRPVVEVEAPEGWVGARVEFAPPVVVAPVVIDHRGRGRAEVGGAVGVGIGVDVHVVAPPPPSVHIGIGISGGVGVSGGAGVVVGGHRHR
jgi:hypothetical protein